MREGWELKTLADLFDIGSSKRVYESQWRSSGVPFYRAREIVKLSRDGYVDNELFIDEDLYNDYANKYGIPKCGDIMVTGVGTLGVCYIVKENDRFYFKDGNTLWFKTKDGTNPFFVNYAFKSNFLRQQIENCNGATVGTYTIVRAKQTTIPIPPLPEQERIVSELDLLSSIIEKKKAQLEEYDQLAQSIFYDMFGDLLEAIPTTTLKDVASYFIGLTYKPSDVSEEGIVVLRSSNIQNNILDFNDIVRVNLNVGDNKIVNDGDILMCARNGSARLVGKVARIRNIEEKMSFGAFMTIIRSKYNDFLFHFFLSDFFRRQLTTSKTATINQITSKMLDNIKLNVPPLPLQQSFAEKIEVIERQKELIKQSIAETETLFNSRMDYYFN